MKFIEKPTVLLMEVPTLRLEAVQQFLADHDREWPGLAQQLAGKGGLEGRDAEWLTEFAARLCYMSFGRGRSHEDHLGHLIEVGHGSVFEHAYFNFVAYGISRSLTHELVRHRTGVSYSQLSQRYVDSSDADVCVPPDFVEYLRPNRPELYQEWVDHQVRSVALYEKLTEAMAPLVNAQDAVERRKKARQSSRSALTNATETKVYFGANVRSIRHIVEMRANPAADVEIRMFAVALFECMKREFPLFFADMEVEQLPDGTWGVRSDHRKI